MLTRDSQVGTWGEVAGCRWVPPADGGADMGPVAAGKQPTLVYRPARHAAVGRRGLRHGRPPRRCRAGVSSARRLGSAGGRARRFRKLGGSATGSRLGKMEGKAISVDLQHPSVPFHHAGLCRRLGTGVADREQPPACEQAAGCDIRRRSIAGSGGCASLFVWCELQALVRRVRAGSPVPRASVTRPPCRLHGVALSAGMGPAAVAIRRKRSEDRGGWRGHSLRVLAFVLLVQDAAALVCWCVW